MFDFFKKKDSLITELVEMISNFESTCPVGGVGYVFGQSKKMAKKLSVRDVKNEMYGSNTTLEAIALNIIQNCAMLNIKPQSASNFLLCDNKELELYDYINLLKLEKKYISDEQFEENKLLGVKMSMVPPLGTWL